MKDLLICDYLTYYAMKYLQYKMSLFTYIDNKFSYDIDFPTYGFMLKVITI